MACGAGGDAFVCRFTFLAACVEQIARIPFFIDGLGYGFHHRLGSDEPRSIDNDSFRYTGCVDYPASSS